MTISSGVSVKGNGYSIIVFGALHTDGAMLTNTSIQGGNNTSSRPSSIVLKSSSFSNGKLLPATGNAVYTHIEMCNNQFTDMLDYSYIWYPVDETHITGNTFTNCGSLSIGSRYDVFITNNTFRGHSGPSYEDAVIENWAQYDGSHCYVHFNKLDYTGTVLKLPASYSNANMVADHNYWYTSDESAIDSRIYDYNDDYSCAGVIPYLPILDEQDSRNVIALPAGLQAIGDEAFANTACEVVLVPATCSSIGENAFAGCVQLYYVELPTRCGVASTAFKGCPDVVLHYY